MKKFNLINLKTNEKHLCEKVFIDGHDYYVSDGVITDEGFYISWETNYATEPKERYVLYVKSTGLNGNNPRKVIATNNPDIDIPKVVDEVEKLALEETLFQIDLLYNTEQRKKDNKKTITALYFEGLSLYKTGYNKAKETYQFTNEDVYDIMDFIANNPETKNMFKGEILQLWKEQQSKIVYYNG